MVNINNNIREIIATANSINKMVIRNAPRLDLTEINRQLEDIVDSLDYVQAYVVEHSKVIA